MPIDIFVLDTRTYRWVEVPKPNPLDAEESESSSNDLMELDEIDNWPYQRYGHTVSAHGKYIYLFGGYEETNYQFGLDVYSLDLVTMKWTLLRCRGEPPAYRDFHSATAIGDCMYVFGGRCDNGHWPGPQQ